MLYVVGSLWNPGNKTGLAKIRKMEKKCLTLSDVEYADQGLFLKEKGDEASCHYSQLNLTDYLNECEFAPTLITTHMLRRKGHNRLNSLRK